MKSLYVIPNILNRNLLESIKSLSVRYLYTTCCDCVFCKKKSVIDLYINMLRYTGSPWISRISLTLIVDNNHIKVDRWICLSQTVLLTVKFCTFHKLVVIFHQALHCRHPSIICWQFLHFTDLIENWQKFD